MLLTIELQDNFPFHCSNSKSCYATCKAVGTAQRLLALLKGCWHCSKAVGTAQRLLELLKGCWNCSKAVGTAQSSPYGTLSFCCPGETGLLLDLWSWRATAILLLWRTHRFWWVCSFRAWAPRRLWLCPPSCLGNLHRAPEALLPSFPFVARPLPPSRTTPGPSSSPSNN